ncbi:hypothetical protein [Winogradskyella sp.]|uniref:hypothetical protein n=1 Tax=Winogradskyella sp. TaxID=1883156 RepID=UPI0035C819F1
MEDDKFKDKYRLYDYKNFNSRFENIEDLDVHKPLVLHFTGRGKRKQSHYKQSQKLLNMHPSLVENSILIKYGIEINQNYLVDAYPKKSSIINRIIRKLR